MRSVKLKTAKRLDLKVCSDRGHTADLERSDAQSDTETYQPRHTEDFRTGSCNKGEHGPVVTRKG